VSKDHTSNETVPAWLLPKGISFNELFQKSKTGAKGWPSMLDKRIPPKSNKSQIAPMCLMFQTTGVCKKGCLLAHITSRDMSDRDRSTITDLFAAAYAT
jgi:hypothetical protein